jgi:hypothetical protein
LEPNWPSAGVFVGLFFGVSDIYWNLVLHSRPIGSTADRWAIIGGIMKNIMVIYNPIHRVVLLFISVFVLSSCNPKTTATTVLPPSDTATNTATNTLVITPSLTSTMLYPEWPVIYFETFDNNQRGWLLDTYVTDYYQGLFSLIDGRYIVNVRAKKGVFLTIKNNFRTPLHNVDICVDVDKSFGSRNSGYGLVLRENKNSLYYFRIFEETQQYSFSKYINDHWIDIIRSTYTPYILPQLVNQIRVQAKESLFTFFINGKIVNQIIDKSINEGIVSIGIELLQPNDSILVAFDNYEVREPEK